MILFKEHPYKLIYTGQAAAKYWLSTGYEMIMNQKWLKETALLGRSLSF